MLGDAKKRGWCHVVPAVEYRFGHEAFEKGGHMSFQPITEAATRYGFTLDHEVFDRARVIVLFAGYRMCRALRRRFWSAPKELVGEKAQSWNAGAYYQRGRNCFQREGCEGRTHTAKA